MRSQLGLGGLPLSPIDLIKPYQSFWFPKPLVAQEGKEMRFLTHPPGYEKLGMEDRYQKLSKCNPVCLFHISLWVGWGAERGGGRDK